MRTLLHAKETPPSLRPRLYAASPTPQRKRQTPYLAPRPSPLPSPLAPSRANKRGLFGAVWSDRMDVSRRTATPLLLHVSAEAFIRRGLAGLECTQRARREPRHWAQPHFIAASCPRRSICCAARARATDYCANCRATTRLRPNGGACCSNMSRAPRTASCGLQGERAPAPLLWAHAQTEAGMQAGMPASTDTPMRSRAHKAPRACARALLLFCCARRLHPPARAWRFCAVRYCTARRGLSHAGRAQG